VKAHRKVLCEHHSIGRPIANGRPYRPRPKTDRQKSSKTDKFTCLVGIVKVSSRWRRVTEPIIVNCTMTISDFQILRRPCDTESAFDRLSDTESPIQNQRKRRQVINFSDGWEMLQSVIDRFTLARTVFMRYIWWNGRPFDSSSMRNERPLTCHFFHPIGLSRKSMIKQFYWWQFVFTFRFGPQLEEDSY
jgi:hypothetical protein